MEGAAMTGNGMAPSWRDTIITAEELRLKAFPPPSFVIPTLLPEGCAILSGKPKAGKSFMALDLCIGVTTGEMVLGSIRPAIGSAIYAANEDTARRLKGRIAKYLSPFDEWPDLLSLTNQWRRLDEGGVDDLRDWASSVQAPRLAVIDTLATVRPARRSTESPTTGTIEPWPSCTTLSARCQDSPCSCLQHNRKADCEIRST